jgi:hypothetical protein
MSSIRRLAAPLVLLLLAACDGDGVSPRTLVGEWEFTTESSNVEWRRDEVRLELREDGGYVRTHAIFADDGRPGDGLRAYTAHHGTYVVQGDSLIAGISIVERWNNQMVVPEPLQENPGFGASERFRMQLTGDRLLLEETRDVDGQPVTYHHTFRRASVPSWFSRSD